jgi:hypothetical protein
MSSVTISVAAGPSGATADAAASNGQDNSLQAKLIGKWTNQIETKGPATINIVSVDSTRASLKENTSRRQARQPEENSNIVGRVSCPVLLDL